jgi:hypothetical protein
MKQRALSALLMLISLASLPDRADGQTNDDRPAITLSQKHREAVDRKRRIIMQYDINCEGMPFGSRSGGVGPELRQEAIDFHMAPLRQQDNQIDSVWWEWGEGEVAQWPSEVLQTQATVFPRWWEAGLDPIALIVEATHDLGREAFLSYRINGSPWTLQPLEAQVFKMEHLQWTHKGLPDIPTSLFWDFSAEEVRKHKVRILKEVANRYDFDGISLDFARVPVLFRAGQQWLQRDALTDLIRQVRHTLLDAGKDRGRPYLLAARVPENLTGCHFDGMDIEQWVREGLVDILALGCRSSEVDIDAFRRLCEGRGIKLYPSFDDHHSSDGYHEAPVEVWRGVCANWWAQGADGMHTFNLVFSPREAREALGSPVESFSRHVDHGWQRQCGVFQEIGSPSTLDGKDKVFYVQRRGGGHGPTVVPNAEDWNTPRHMYFNTNMFGALPASLANDGKADTQLTLNVADDVNAAVGRIKRLFLRMVLSDPAAGALPAEERLEEVVVANQGRPGAPGYAYRNTPPAKGIEKLIEVRINNILLGTATIEGGEELVMQAGDNVDDGIGWLAFPVEPKQLAVGENLVGVRVTSRPEGARDEIIIERLELHVDYE